MPPTKEQPRFSIFKLEEKINLFPPSEGRVHVDVSVKVGTVSHIS